MAESINSESTKKTLIITVGIVITIVVVAVLSWKIITMPPKCKDGTTATRIDPDGFVLEYAGKKIVIDTNVQNKIKASFSIEDKVLQQAITATQLLDQRLRFVIVEYNASACDPEGRALLRKINKLKSDDLIKLMALQKEISELALSNLRVPYSRSFYPISVV